MKVYRIEREKYLETTLKGIGAAKTEGYRWNSLDTYIVYTASSRALATMEVAVHLDLNEDLPKDRFYVEIEIPEGVEILDLDVSDLPANWDSKPPSLETQLIGDSFVNSNQFAVLRVPSSIVPPEYNYLINPNHEDASNIKVTSLEIMSFDKRIKPKPTTKKDLKSESKFINLDLTVRLLNCLASIGEKDSTLSEFQKKYSVADLLKFRNFGKKSITELRQLYIERDIEPLRES